MLITHMKGALVGGCNGTRGGIVLRGALLNVPPKRSPTVGPEKLNGGVSECAHDSCRQLQ